MKEYLINLLEGFGLAQLDYEVLGNTLGDYAITGIALVVFLFLFRAIQWLVLRKLQKLAERTTSDIDDTLIRIFKTIKPPFYSFLAFYLAATFFLSLTALTKRIITVLLIVWAVYQVINGLQILIDYVVKRAMRGEGEDAKVAAGLIGKISKVVLWVIALMLILSNFGVNVNSLIAGLGIGGIAVAFALQNILADLFSSFAIYFDKPFAVDDFIVVGEHKGTVERIGIKSTRIRSLSGEEIIISNQELTSARIHNYRTTEERRLSFDVGVVYETPNSALKEIPKILEDIIGGVDSARFDRAHLVRFDDSSITFEVVYYVETGDYKEYLDAVHEANLKINEEFEKRGISMAYPTRTVHIEGGGDNA